MKSFEYQIQTAINIADNDENAYVGVFFSSSRGAKQAFNDTRREASKGMFKIHDLSYTSESGGTVVFLSTQRVEDFGGYELTYAFVTDNFDYKTISFIESRVRSRIAPL